MVIIDLSAVMKIANGVFKVVSVEGNCNNDIIKVWYLLWRNNFMLLLSTRDDNVLLHYCTPHPAISSDYAISTASLWNVNSFLVLLSPGLGLAGYLSGPNCQKYLL